MKMRKAVGAIGVAGLIIAILTFGGSCSKAGKADAVLRMVPADSLFCVRINNLDRTLVELDQYIAGVAPTAVGPMAKTQLGGLLGNPSLAGVKTDGVFALFGSAPAEAQGPEALMQGLSILAPVSDYGLFISNSSRLGKPDAQGVSAMAGTSVYAANAGKFALIGPSADAATFAALAATLKAGPAKSLAGVLDADETASAAASPLWIHVNVPAVAKLVGPGVGDKIRQAMAAKTQAQAGPLPGPNMAALFDMYAGLAETLLKELRSVAVTVAPKPAVLSFGVTVAALPGTPLASLMTRSGPSGLKDSKLLGYLEDGATMTGAWSVDPANLARFFEMGLDIMTAGVGDKASDADMTPVKAFVDDLAASLGGEMAFSASLGPQAGAFYSGTYVFELKDKDRWLQLLDRTGDLLKTPFLARLFEPAGISVEFSVQHAAATYKDVAIDSARLAITYKDPESPQARMMQGLYNGLEYRMAVVGRLGLMAIGPDADAGVRKLIDLAKAGGPKQMGAEIKAAMAVLPEAGNANFMATYNVVRMLGMARAMMPGPGAAGGLSSKSNMVWAWGADKGKMSFRMAMPKEHLTEIIKATGGQAPKQRP